jgi:O-antigen/teichoic acid export membrane protein
LNFILIPLYKAEGAAIATLITQWLTALIQVIMVYKILKLNVNLKLAATLVVLTSFVAGTYFATQALDFSFSMAIITVFSTGIIAAFLVRLLRVSDLKEMLSGKKE